MVDTARHFLMDISQSDVVGRLCSAQWELWKNEDFQQGISIWSDRFSLVKQESVAPETTLETEEPAENEPAGRPRRAAANGRKSADFVYSELRSGSVAPHHLVEPHKFGDSGGVAPDEAQPFRVVVHPQVMVLSDLHSQMSSSEVIGLLAGKWDAAHSVLFVQTAVPCAALDSGATDVEMDPEAEHMARMAIDNVGLTIVGWYHSHPKFKPEPSVIDLSNQYSYQTYLTDPATGVSPFIGLIVSTCEKDNPSALSPYRWFVVKRYRGKLFSPDTDVALPLVVDAEVPRLQLATPEAEVDACESMRRAIFNLQMACHSKIMTTFEVKVEAPEPIIAQQPVKRGRGRPPKSKKDGEVVTRVAATKVQPPSAAPLETSAEGGGRARRKASLRFQELITQIAAESSAGEESRGKRRREEPEPSAGRGARSASKAQDRQPNPDEFNDARASPAAAPVEPPEPLFTSLIVTLQHPALQSSELARTLLCRSPPELIYLTTHVVSLAIYYSRYEHRVELSLPWRGYTRVEKVRLNARRWLAYFDAPAGVMTAYLDMTIDLLIACWAEYTRTGKLKGRGKKTK